MKRAHRGRKPSLIRRVAHVGELAVVATSASVGGAVVEYLLDPDRGHARRARLRDICRARAREQVAHQRHAASRTFRRVVNPRLGVIRSRLAHRDDPDGITLVQKVRSEVLGHFERDLRGRLVIDATNGTVVVRGVVDDERERMMIVEAISRVRGVRRVESLLHSSTEDPPNKAAVLHLRPAS